MINEKTLTMAYLSKLVYSNEYCVQQKLKYVGEFENFRWFEKNNICAFAIYDTTFKNLIICFRGFESLNISSILQIWPSRDKTGFVYSGFVKALNEIYDLIITYILNINKFCTIISIGHSLGGALAVVLASRIQINEIYTFGSPKVGTRNFVKTLSKRNLIHYRFVNEHDVITRLPLYFYKHYGAEFNLKCFNSKCKVYNHSINKYISSLYVLFIKKYKLTPRLIIIMEKCL